ncbi:hypothetical protein NADFUDRAFT_83845 [Nadsonia fulvescens var. elongata DSM 6958]|uniref:SET domain-containing protein n=1 Tax=Nadsonia fulvescens var. elongata DSM 6958 TaxID=857566 RepID=A0A1E3PG83_9ASCO|nr:hypothetical protein NADFUDRAFT_83845 [Nadsonia fulvescens var. elongata DSM 6958]
MDSSALSGNSKAAVTSPDHQNSSTCKILGPSSSLDLIGNECSPPSSVSALLNPDTESVCNLDSEFSTAAPSVPNNAKTTPEELVMPSPTSPRDKLVRKKHTAIPSMVLNKAKRSNDSHKNSSLSPPDPVPIDSGIIRCICDFSDDDGFTIQCERCNIWQHAVCVGINNENDVPEIYLCDKCHPRLLDIKAAQAKQRKRLEAINRRRNLLRERHNNSRLATNETYSEYVNSLNGSESPKDLPSSRRNRFSRSLTSETNEENTDSEEAVRPNFNWPVSRIYSDYYTHVEENRIPSDDDKNFMDQLPERLRNDNTTTMHFTKPHFDNINVPKVTVKQVIDHSKQKFKGFSQLGLFINSSIPRDGYIIQYVGDIYSKKRYKLDCINQYRDLGCPKLGVMFHHSLPLVIDGRIIGNESRFLRRSCTPNCRVNTVVVDQHRIVFAVFATETIKEGSELTVSWEWDEQHPIQKVIRNTPIDQLTESEKQYLVYSADLILQKIECACNSGPDCTIARMKKACGPVQRSTRQSKAKQKSEEYIKKEVINGIGDTIIKEPLFWPVFKAKGIPNIADVLHRVVRSKILRRENAISRKIQAIRSEELRQKPLSVKNLSETPKTFASKGLQTEVYVKRLRDSDDEPNKKPRHILFDHEKTREGNDVALPFEKKILKSFLLLRQEYNNSPDKVLKPRALNYSQLFSGTDGVISPVTSYGPLSPNLSSLPNISFPYGKSLASAYQNSHFPLGPQALPMNSSLWNHQFQTSLSRSNSLEDMSKHSIPANQISKHNKYHPGLPSHQPTQQGQQSSLHFQAQSRPLIHSTSGQTNSKVAPSSLSAENMVIGSTLNNISLPTTTTSILSPMLTSTSSSSQPPSSPAGPPALRPTAKPIKKLSFADYRKKTKPTSSPVSNEAVTTVSSENTAFASAKTAPENTTVETTKINATTTATTSL